MSAETILVSGAGVAGPTLAYWLARHGFRPTVVERAPALREGGQAVDFRGPAHRSVLQRMGLWDEIQQHQTRMGEHRFVDAAGETLVTLPASFMSGEVEILRGDLVRILHERTKSEAEYLFGDAITQLTATEAGVDVSFERGAPRRFDLVIGADGLHSGVRALAFGDEPAALRFLGYYLATFRAPNHLGLDRCGVAFRVPGRSAGLASYGRGGEARASFVFASPPLVYDRRDGAAQRRLVREAYRGVGWEVPRLLEAMDAAGDLYFDSVSMVRLRRCTRGRVALVGDAAYGGTLGGMGTGAAIIAAYVLAGELAAARGDHRVAFPRYEARIQDYARGCQKGAERVGSFFAPRSRAGLWCQERLYRALTSRWLRGALDRLTTSAAAGIELPDYACAT
jgi:2-polyprenyl-6-methoxyphenol hydroxylase-like FAD-dependent oxidoreductase